MKNRAGEMRLIDVDLLHITSFIPESQALNIDVDYAKDRMTLLVFLGDCSPKFTQGTIQYLK